MTIQTREGGTQLEDTTQTAPTPVVEMPETLEAARAPELRLAIIAGFPTIAAGIMTGGLFIGVGGRVWACLCGLAGVALAWRASRIRQPALLYTAMILGIFGIGLVAVLPTGFSNILNVAAEIRRAVSTSDVLRPPVEFLPGWHAIQGWVMATVGFAAGWLGLEIRRPALGVVATLPVVGLGAISLPESQQIGSGLAALVLFVVGLGLLSGATPGDEEERRAARAYEIRRALRALPLLGAITVALYFAAQSEFLFPDPIYDPAQEAKLPKSVPLSEVEDRILFTVDATFTGPWKTGSLDVYDGESWRLPPFAASELKEVPESGIVDESLRPGVRATFTVRGLGGAILPGLPRAVGIVAEGPKLAYDERVGNIRVTQGQIEPGFKYIVVAPSTPAIRQLQRAPADVPGEVREFLDAPDPPPSVVSLLRRAPTDNAWDRIDFLRRHILLNVAASGPGTPVPVAPERVEEMLSRTKRGTPFEIVGAQALLARWGGVPSRIGYGFDRGDEGAGGTLEVRPRHGALFLEVYFEGFGWLPLVGDPLQAQDALSDQPQQFNPTVQTSEDVAVRLFLPVVREEEPRFFERVRTFLFRALPIVGGLALIYYLWPLPFKALRRARRRAWAAERGPAARVSLAYAEWRDYATDFGYRHYTDTPLMFVERATPDQEHEELAWLVTRTLWGDIRGNVTEEDALAAEALSRSLRRRLAATQSPILRLVASLSRLSIRHPYAPELDAVARKLGREERELIHAS